MICINPATNKKFYEIRELTGEELAERLEEARVSFSKYRLSTFEERAEKLNNMADLMETSKDRLASEITEQMGKPIRHALAEVAKSIRAVRHYATYGAGYLQAEEANPAPADIVRAYKSYQPLGPILAVMPWNFPIWQVIRFAAPALMAGNVCLLKHAENVWKTALSLEELFLAAGFEKGCFQTLNVEVSAVEQIIQSDVIAGVTLTGSTRAGRAIAANAAKRLLPVVLELGGSDPFIVLEDGDLEKASTYGVMSRFANSGQSCIAAKRFILHQDIKDDFLRLFLDKISNLSCGDPLLPATDLGPVVNEQALENLEKLIKDALEKGANLLCGGSRVKDEGFFLEPTVLEKIDESMDIYHQEVFGPVALVFTAADESEAILRANDTKYGLGASIWTNDIEKALYLQESLECGMVAVNKEVASYPELPFGGIKSSGYGRELAAEGIRSFCNCKTVVVG